MRRLIIAAALGALALAGCKRNSSWKAAGEYPERTLEATTFPHSKHGGFDCTDCHQEIAKNAKLGTYKAPGADKCAECHDKDAAHTPPTRVARTEYAFKFSHADHLAKLQGKKDACGTCHQVLPEPGEKRKLTPPMSTCTSCHYHEQEVAEARCRPCHVSLKAYGLVPLEQFTEFSHAGNFVKEHGRLAKNSAETCAQCHDQTYCATCHATATRPVKPEILFPENVTSDFIHRGQYVSRHQMDAERDPASCRKCHGSFFCESCHQAQNLSPRSLNPRNPHPRGWAQRGSGAFHGDAARTNIVSCSGCHDQGGAASICVACHQVGGVGGNPHPSGFIRRHDRDDKSKNVACRVCHNR
jgi:hypothetical protein